MPCDTIQYNQILFESAVGHEDILAEALRELGFTVHQFGKSLNFYKSGVSGTYSNGRFSTTNSAEDLNVDQIKQSFGRNVVKAAAKKFGWAVKTQPNGKIKLTKRA